MSNKGLIKITLDDIKNLRPSEILESMMNGLDNFRGIHINGKPFSVNFKTPCRGYEGERYCCAHPGRCATMWLLQGSKPKTVERKIRVGRFPLPEAEKDPSYESLIQWIEDAIYKFCLGDLTDFIGHLKSGGFISDADASWMRQNIDISLIDWKYVEEYREERDFLIQVIDRLRENGL